MFRRTSSRLAEKLRTAELYQQINPFPMRNWRAHQAEKLAPDAEAGKAALHKAMVNKLGEDYDKITENNFPYPLIYCVLIFIWSLCNFLNIPSTLKLARNTNLPQLTWNEKNADGSTKFPTRPENPSAFFETQLEIKGE